MINLLSELDGVSYTVFIWLCWELAPLSLSFALNGWLDLEARALCGGAVHFLSSPEEALKVWLPHFRIPEVNQWAQGLERHPILADLDSPISPGSCFFSVGNGHLETIIWVDGVFSVLSPGQKKIIFFSRRGKHCTNDSNSFDSNLRLRFFPYFTLDLHFLS